MLRSLITYALILSATLALLIVTAIFIGFQQPPSEWVSFLHLNDCELPCWIGIEPGKTTFAEAVSQVEQVYRDLLLYKLDWQSYSQISVTYRLNESGFSVGFGSSDGLKSTSQSIVQVIGLSFNEPLDVAQPRIADLYIYLGSPEALRLSIFSATPLAIFHRSEQIEIDLWSFECNKVFPTQQISAIKIDTQSLNNLDGIGWRSDSVLWRGFQRCNSFLLYKN